VRKESPFVLSESKPSRSSGSLILATSARLAKSTTAKPFEARKLNEKCGAVVPSAAGLEAIGRTGRSNLTSHEGFSVSRSITLPLCSLSNR